VITLVASNSPVVSISASALVIQVTVATVLLSHRLGGIVVHAERHDDAKAKQQPRCWCAGWASARVAPTQFRFAASFVASHE